MKIIVPTITLIACAAASSAVGANYSTEASMTRQKDKGTYEVVVAVSQLVERDGHVTEELISRPKVRSSPGVPASVYIGLQPPHADYTRKENVSVDVSWPEVGKSDFAVCTITVKLGDKLVSKTKTKVAVEEK